MNVSLYSLGYSLVMFGAADINQALSKGGGTIFKFAFLLGCVFIIGGGIQIRNGDGGAALYSIVGGLVVACAAPIMRELFQNAGMGGSAIDIGWNIRPTVNYCALLTKNYLQGAAI